MSKMSAENALLTGYPSFTARTMLRYLMKQGNRVHILVLERYLKRARKDVEKLESEGLPGEAVLLTGDVRFLDLGLSGLEVDAIAKEVSVIHHMAGMGLPGSTKEQIQKVHLLGTRRILEVAQEIQDLRRFCHYSTAQVAGTREGVILERELDMGQRFHNSFEEVRFRSERIVQSLADKMPISIFRPSIIAGNSKTGEMDRHRGPHQVLALYSQLPARVPLPLPGQGHFPLNLVPVDYVVEAAYILSRDSKAEGRTFHLTDSNPLSVRGVFNLISDLTGRARPFDAAANMVPYRIARTAMRLPILERRARGASYILDALHSLQIYSRLNTDECLRGRRLKCPGFSDYAEKLVDHMRNSSPFDFDIRFDEDEV
jgi:nucleoside-diphosphate-sugar epimerase